MTETWKFSDQEWDALTPEQRRLVGNPEALAAKTAAAKAFTREVGPLAEANKMTRDLMRNEREIEEMTGRAAREAELAKKVDRLESELRLRDKQIIDLKRKVEEATAKSALAVSASGSAR